MANVVYCAYCFEVLCASLGKQQPLRLRQVEASWDKYASLSEGVNVDCVQFVEEDKAYDLDGDVDGIDGVKTLPSQRRHGSKFADGTLRAAAQIRAAAPSPSLSSSSGSPYPVSTPSSSSATSLGANNSSDSSVAPASPSSSSRRSLFSFANRSPRDGRGADGTAEEYPLFVTWNIVSKSGNRALRGCIGTFEPQRIEEGLKNYALTSAFDDSRFNPISVKELPALEVSVTLLTNFESAADAFDWDIGKHGIRISFTHHRRRLGATYLPDVPKEQGWDKEETIVSLMRKAGWSGRQQDWKKVMDLEVVRYQGKKVSLEYDQWRKWKDWSLDMNSARA